MRGIGRQGLGGYWRGFLGPRHPSVLEILENASWRLLRILAYKSFRISNIM